MATLLGTLGIGITADLAGLSKGLDTATKSLTDFGKKTESMGKSISDTGTTMTKWVTGPIVAVGAGMLALAGNVGKFADSLLVQSAQTGLSMERLQEWRYVAGQVGVSSDAVSSAIMGLSRRLMSLDGDTGTGAEALKNLGLEFEDLKKRDPAEVFDLILERLSKIPDTLTRNSTAAKIFGGGWAEIAPIIAEGADNVEALRQRAHELGLIIEDEGIKQADEFGDAWDDVKQQLLAAKNTIGIQLAPTLRTTLVPLIQNTVIPALKDFGDALAKLFKWFGSLPQSTQQTIIKIIALVAAVGPAVLIIGKLVTAVGLLSGAFGAMLTNPIILGLVAVAAAAVAVATRFAEAKQSAIELQQAYVDLGTTLFETSQSINDALELMANGVGMLDHLIGQVAFDSLIAQLDALKVAVLDVPADQMETAWRDGVNRIFDALEAEYPKLEKVLDKYRRGFLDSGGDMIDDMAEGIRKQESQLTTAIDDVLAAGLGSAANATEGFAAVGTKAGVAFGEGLSIGLNETAEAVGESFSAVGDNALLNLQTQGKLITTEAERIAADTKARLDALMLESAETMRQAAEGYTPAFEDLQTQVNAAVWAFEMARQTFGEQSLEAAAAFSAMLTVQERLKSVSDDLWTNLQQVNGPLLDLIVYMKQYTGEIEKDEAFMQSFIAHQLHAKDVLDELGISVEQMTGQWWEEALVVRAAGDEAEETAKKTEKLGAATDVTFGKLRYAPGIFGDVVTALKLLSEQAKVTAQEFLQSVSQNIASALESFGESVLTMGETNKQLAADHKATLEQIDADYQEAATSAADARDKELQNLKDNLADGKITQEQYTRDMRQVWADYNKDFAKSEKKRETALDDEAEAYKEQKVTIGKLISDIVHTVLLGIARQLLGYAAEHAALMLINLALMNFVQAAKEAAAAGIAGLAAAGVGILESAVPFHSGGIVSSALGEEPVIRAKAGEGLFTPDQMAAMGTIDYGLLGDAVHAGVADAMEEIGMGANRPMILQVDGKTFGRIALPLIQREKVRLGLEAV